MVESEVFPQSPSIGRVKVNYSLSTIERSRKRLLYQQRVVEKLRAVGVSRSLAVAIDILAVMEGKLAFLIGRHDRLLVEARNGQQNGLEQSAPTLI